MKRNQENFKRKQIVLWCFIQMHKQRVVSLSMIETHFKCYCEHILKEAVLNKFFYGTTVGSKDVGWYLHPHTKDMTTAEFQEELNKHYSL